MATSMDSYVNDPTVASSYEKSYGTGGAILDNLESLFLPGIRQEKFNASEAAKTRDYQTYMSNTAYQRAAADMKAAGLNPAMMYSAGGHGASSPSGATGSSSGGSSMLTPIITSAINAGASMANTAMRNSADLTLAGRRADGYRMMSMALNNNANNSATLAKQIATLTKIFAK